ncbi:diiron oxygenase [Kribbella sp. NPDC006257]|uniref:diiron oxygenase n=1 Tax=Kribbella sp. NPDC006257 TaxID=3156738 RepID=UPI0033A9C7C9
MDIFADWDKQATVRSGLRRVLRDESDMGKRLFPVELVQYLDHPLLAHAVGSHSGTTHRILTQQLYQYLLFTIHFEVKIVNRVTQLIATESMPHSISPETRLAAFKIYTDEGYHALFSLDLVTQIEAATEIPALPYTFDPFLAAVDRTIELAMPGNIPLGRILQVVVFETAVTSMLENIPRDRGVATLVRETVADHARDEKFHHAFFARFFLDLWASLPTDMKAEVAFAMPRLIVTSLSPYLQPYANILSDLGLSTEDVQTVLRDTYDRRQVLATVRHSARHSVRLCEKAGVLEVPGAAEAFRNAGLLTS